MLSRSHAKQLLKSLPGRGSEGFSSCLYRKLIWEEQGWFTVSTVSQTLPCPCSQSVLGEAAGSVLLLLYVSHTGVLPNVRRVQGCCETDAVFFKQRYSISWAKEKVTVHMQWSVCKDSAEPVQSAFVNKQLLLFGEKQSLTNPTWPMRAVTTHPLEKGGQRTGVQLPK